MGEGEPVFVGEPVAVAAVDAVVLAEEVSDSAGLADASASPASDGAEEAAAAGEKVAIADRVALSERERVAECDALVVIEDDSDEVGLVVTLTDAEAEDVAVEVAMAVQKTCDPPPVETVDEVQPVAAHAVQ